MSLQAVMSETPWSIRRLVRRLVSPLVLRLGALLLLGVLPCVGQAQIAFRAAATGTALVPTLRAATTSGIVYRGSATTPAGATSLTPVYRAAASASAASGVLTITITKPAGTIENDVMVATIGVSANAPTITPPADWTLVRRMTNAVATANSLAVYTKVATATEPANYSWTFSASGGSAGGIQTFYNVDILTPVDAENGQTTASSLTHATPSITTTVANTMLVTSYTFSSSRGWNTPLAPPAPAVTERFDVRSNGNNATGQSTAAHQGVVAAAGVVPALTATASANADTGNTHVLALRPALRVPRLAATATGDFMIAAIGVQPSTATVTAPAGWTLVNRIDNAAATSNSLVIYRKFALTGEPASYLWQLSGATAAVAGIQTFAGVDATTPVGAQNGQATASNLTHTAPIIATTVDNALLVGHYTFASASSWTTVDPAGTPVAMTESFDVRSSAVGAAGQSLEGTRTVQAAPGASAAYASLAAADADAGAAHIMALQPSATSVVIGLPGGTVVNDVLIASIGIAWSGGAAPVVTPPAGWTLVRQIDNNNATRNSLAVFRKTAAAGEPAAYEFGVTNAAYMVGGIQGFYNVDTTTPIDAENGQNTPSGRDHATPTITTTVANTMLVGSYTYASSQTWTPRTPPTPAMTESFDKPSGGAANTGQSIEGTRLVQSAVGLVPAYTSRAAGGAPTYDRGNTHILALRSASPLLVISKPTGTVANDVMIASIGVAWGTAAPVATPPAGWTLVRQIDDNNATRNSLFIYRKVAGGSEPASYTWNFTNFSFATGGIQSFSGVNTTTPIDVENGALTASGTTHATPTVTTTVANTMLVTSHTYASSGTWTPPVGMTEGFDVAAWTAPNALGQSTEGSYVLQAAAAATGAKTATASTSADRGNAHIVALRPATVVPPPSSFNVFETSTAASAITGRIYTKLATAGPFGLDVVAISSGAQASGFSNNVKAELLANSTPGSNYGADNCPTSNSVVQAIASAAIASGRSTVSFSAVAVAYRDIRVRVSYPTSSPTVVSCSTDSFAIRPGAVTLWPPWATPPSATATPTLTPGIAFLISATTATAATDGYTGTLSPDTSKLTAQDTSQDTVVQSGGTVGTFLVTSPLIANESPLSTGRATYTEVGYLYFALGAFRDDAFTAVDQPSGCAGTDSCDCVTSTTGNANLATALAGGKYGCSIGNTTTASLGRFRTHHFDTEVTDACGSGSFTYSGQPFGLKVTAKNSTGGTTTNYTGVFAKTVTLSDVNAAAGAFSPTTLAASSFVNGVADLTATPSVTFTYTSKLTTPSTLKVRVTNTEGGSSSSTEGTTALRSGRLRLQNVFGSEKSNLLMPVQAHYWSGNSWILNIDDSCTSLPANAFYPYNAAAGTNASAVTIGGGSGTLALTKPTTPTAGNVDVAVNLGTTGDDQSCLGNHGGTPASKPWLRSQNGNCAATYDRDPSARATFGLISSPEARKSIHIRESY